MRLGDTDARGSVGMLNLIGEMPIDRSILEVAPWHLHEYGKDPRPGRKLGHATVVTEDPLSRDEALRNMALLLNI
jgi:5-(carboxyamino)imidazole ribonucleotide synthase